MKIGVLALQGAFIEHIRIMQDLGVETVEIRQRRDFTDDISGLILPGGESTTMGKLLKELNITDPIKNRILGGMPVFGTCAGAILLAKDVQDGDAKIGLNTMDISVKRNAYGRQLGSFFVEEKFGLSGEEIVVPMSFIRAPVITQVMVGDVLATVDGKIVAARQDNQLVTTFHPELKTDAVHKYFLDMIRD